ncbi:MAG: sasA [Chthoniobacteraceae bacterium]|nr:sasA [Chthoniobacteraceae bacterium]
MPCTAGLDVPALNDHMPDFIDEIVATLAHPAEAAPLNKAPISTPPVHALQRFSAGFDITEVVAEYNLLRDVILYLAEEADLLLSARDHCTLNRIIDGAIANAVETFALQQAVSLQTRREEEVAFLVHDVRSPLNSISLTAALLAEDCMGRDSATDEMFRTLQRSVQRIDALLYNVLQSQRNLGTGQEIRVKRGPVDLWSLVQRSMTELAAVAADSGTILRNAVPRLLSLYADAEQIARVFQNLIGNAIRFSPEGVVEVGAKGEGSRIECWVRDDGIGIHADRLNRVFDKLETDPDPKRAGLGLGLAIVKQIIEAHGGEITVESQEGCGAIFRFILTE